MRLPQTHGELMTFLSEPLCGRWNRHGLGFELSQAVRTTNESDCDNLSLLLRDKLALEQTPGLCCLVGVRTSLHRHH